MKRLVVVAFLLSGCAYMQEPATPPANLEEAYMNAQGVYIAILKPVVNFKKDCEVRPPEFRDDCWPVVERLREVAKRGIEYRQALEIAYKAGNEDEFSKNYSGLKAVQTVIIAQVARETARQKEMNK